MTAQIIYGDKTVPLNTSCSTVLHAIQDAGIEFAAPCGGADVCKKCAVWLRDASGLRRELACQIAPADDMAVYIDVPKPFTIAESGSSHPFAADRGRDGFGLAVDVGTTTVVMRLISLSDGTVRGATSRPNPQITYGSDVIARITASMNGSLPAMTTLIGRALGEMARDLCEHQGIDRDDIVFATLAGNTVMESIACGVSPDPIGVSPFIPLDCFGGQTAVPAYAPHTYCAACLSGYVGGDITADLIACDLVRSPQLRLMLDLGTNGEMALGNENRLLTCATAAGPVFEGANIVFGMPARSGAISKVSVEDGMLRLRTIDDASPFGICGTGIIDAVAMLLDTGIVDETGRMAGVDELDELDGLSEDLACRIDEDELGPRFRLADGIYLTQADIRNVQLAKAAICAGIYTLLEAFGATVDDIDELLIAGGFGSFLDAESAARIGLFPDELRNRARSIGNAAIEGASALLVSAEAEQLSDRIVGMNEYVELSTSAAFNGYYVDCMAFE